MFVRKFQELFQDPRAKSFVVIMLIFGVSTGMFLGILNNYLYEILSITKFERGVVEFPRELPGLLLVVIFSLFYKLCETRVLRLSVFVAFLGVVGLSLWGEGRTIAIFMIVLWSTGEHLIMPIRNSMGIHMAKPGKEGLALGMVRSMANLGQVVGFYLIPLIFGVLVAHHLDTTPFVKFRSAFLFAGFALLIGLMVAFKMKVQERHVKRNRFFIRKRYWRYYVLEMFFGARKQVFLTFAPYVLIVLYGTSTQMMAILFGIFSTLNIFLAPAIGKLIDHWGYKKVIILDTIVLISLCLLYGFSHLMFPHTVAYVIVRVVFILDSVLFAVTVARTVYVKAVSHNQEEVTATLSTGISINHMISIIIAILGGFLWQKFGVEVLFSMAAVFGVGSFIFAKSLPAPHANK